MQSISVRSARGGAIAAAAAVRQASLSTAAHCSLAAVRSTGDGGFLERCSGLSRRWRKRLSACARGVARCTALLLPLQVEPPSQDALLAQRSCECSNDQTAYGMAAKEDGPKPVGSIAQACSNRALTRPNRRILQYRDVYRCLRDPCLRHPRAQLLACRGWAFLLALCRSLYWS